MGQTDPQAVWVRKTCLWTLSVWENLHRGLFLTKSKAVSFYSNDKIALQMLQFKHPEFSDLSGSFPCFLHLVSSLPAAGNRTRFREEAMKTKWNPAMPRLLKMETKRSYLCFFGIFCSFLGEKNTHNSVSEAIIGSHCGKPVLTEAGKAFP